MARPKKAILSKNLIRDQALSIIDEEGMDALTMRRLATRLGVQAASLYTRFPNKEAMLDAIAVRLAKRIDPTGFEESWQEGVRTWANSFYAAIHWHPNAAPDFAVGSRERADLLTMADQVEAGLLSHEWPARHATMVTAAAGFVMLGAPTKASRQLPDDGVPRPGDRTPAGPSTSQLDHFAETIDRASFTLALDALIAGLEPVHAQLARGGERSPRARRR